MSELLSKTTELATELPTPDERPGSDVLIYDGHCRICSTQVRRFPWWDNRHRLSYLSLHDPQVAERFPDLTHEALMRDMYVVDRQGRPYRGADAFRYLTRRLPRLWWLAPLLHVPLSLPVWQFLYRKLADRRYRFGTIDACDDDECAVHFKAR